MTVQIIKIESVVICSALIAACAAGYECRRYGIRIFIQCLETGDAAFLCKAFAVLITFRKQHVLYRKKTVQSKILGHGDRDSVVVLRVPCTVQKIDFVLVRSGNESGYGIESVCHRFAV